MRHETADKKQLKETLRIWPPVAWNLPRVVPQEGFTVAGHHFTEGVRDPQLSSIFVC